MLSESGKKRGSCSAKRQKSWEEAGAQCIAICAHALHKVADQIQESISIPIIHIMQSTSAAVKAVQARRPLILTTRYTDINDVYLNTLRKEYSFEPVLPDAGGQAVVHDIVYHELCRGYVNEESRSFASLPDQ